MLANGGAGSAMLCPVGWNTDVAALAFASASAVMLAVSCTPAARGALSASPLQRLAASCWLQRLTQQPSAPLSCLTQQPSAPLSQAAPSALRHRFPTRGASKRSCHVSFATQQPDGEASGGAPGGDQGSTPLPSEDQMSAATADALPRRSSPAAQQPAAPGGDQGSTPLPSEDQLPAAPSGQHAAKEAREAVLVYVMGAVGAACIFLYTSLSSLFAALRELFRAKRSG
ncbi:hypothetical protein ABPG75_007150 [Micractinium tetrahymenae]